MILHSVSATSFLQSFLTVCCCSYNCVWVGWAGVGVREGDDFGAGPQGQAFHHLCPTYPHWGEWSITLIPYSLELTPPFLLVRFSYKYGGGGGLIIE